MAIDVPAQISASEYQRRLDACRLAAEAQGLDVLVACADSLRPGHVLYLTGYVPFNGTAVVAVTADACHLLTDADWDLAAARDAAWLDDAHINHAADFAAGLRDIVGSDRARVGIIGFELMAASVYARLLATTSWQCEDTGRILEGLRVIKSGEEITLLREASRITDAGAAAFRSRLEEGMSELELAVAVEAAMKLSGTNRLTFPTNLGSGERTHLVSPSPTAKRIERGELVLLDCGATFGGYCGDMARTTVIGEPTPEQRRQLDCVAEMFEASRTLLQPGTTFGQIHEAAARAAEAGGFRHEFGSGHSIGVQNHEFPDIAAGATTVLEPNMVVALEPLLIVPGVGGVRLEDTFLITEVGAEPLMAEPLRQWA